MFKTFLVLFDTYLQSKILLTYFKNLRMQLILSNSTKKYFQIFIVDYFDIKHLPS